MSRHSFVQLNPSVEYGHYFLPESSIKSSGNYYLHSANISNIPKIYTIQIFRSYLRSDKGHFYDMIYFQRVAIQSDQSAHWRPSVLMCRVLRTTYWHLHTLPNTTGGRGEFFSSSTTNRPRSRLATYSWPTPFVSTLGWVPLLLGHRWVWFLR